MTGKEKDKHNQEIQARLEGRQVQSMPTTPRTSAFSPVNEEAKDPCYPKREEFLQPTTTMQRPLLKADDSDGGDSPSLSGNEQSVIPQHQKPQMDMNQLMSQYNSEESSHTESEKEAVQSQDSEMDERRDVEIVKKAVAKRIRAAQGSLQVIDELTEQRRRAQKALAKEEWLIGQAEERLVRAEKEAVRAREFLSKHQEQLAVKQQRSKEADEAYDKAIAPLIALSSFQEEQ